jgi:3D-(3,5/4)-trihydroxycyclohexane-1,2-dione acylhydrolase (decyclizing)
MSACINAMRVLTDPAETGAVTLCLPQDVQGEAWDYPNPSLPAASPSIAARPAPRSWRMPWRPLKPAVSR